MGEGRGDDGVSSALKFFMFFFNFMLWLMGTAMIALGVWSYIEKNKFAHKQAEDVYDVIFDVSIVVIIAGSLLFIVAFMGCLGALRENICLLKAFATTVAILFILEVVGVILAFVFSSEIKHVLANLIKTEALVRYRDDADFQSLVDWFQETFGCCGVEVAGYRDWSLNPYFNCTEENPSVEKCAVPFSCCRNQLHPVSGILNFACGYNAQTFPILSANNVIYTTGCFQTIIKFAESNMYIVGGVILGIAVPQLFAIFLARIMINQINEQRSRWI